LEIALMENKSAARSMAVAGKYVETLLSQRWVLPGAVLVAALFRLLFIAVAGRQQRFYDEGEYLSIARAIAHGQGYRLFDHPSAYRPPAMPYVLAFCMRLVGDRYWVFALTQAVLLCLLPFLVFWTAHFLRLRRPYAVLAALIVALHPGLNYAATTVYPTTITAVALVLSTLLALKAIGRNSPAHGVMAGLAAGVAASATTIFGPYGILLAVVAGLRRRVRVACVIALFSVLPTGAWVVRNHLVLHTNSVATNGGFNMELGANDQAEPRSGNLIRPDITPEEPFGDEVDWDRDHHARAKTWIAAHRVRFTELFVLRSLAVLDSVGKPATAGLHNSPAAQLAGWAMLPLILLSLAGLWLYRRSPLAWMTGGALALVMLSSGLTIVKPRFRFPIDPLLILFSVAALPPTVSARPLEARQSDPRGLSAG
jgi:hypothetical protein